MRLATLALATALGLTATCALAQSGSSTGGSSPTGGTAASGTTSGAASGTTGSAAGNLNSGMSNDAGSAAAARNSGLNPWGSTNINPSPSGSTLAPAGPGSPTGR